MGTPNVSEHYQLILNSLSSALFYYLVYMLCKEQTENGNYNVYFIKQQHIDT